MIPCRAASYRPGDIRRHLHGRSELRLQLHLRDEGQEQGRDQGRDHLSRHRHQRRWGLSVHSPIRLHGVVDPFFITAADVRDGGRDAAWMRPSSRAPIGPRTQACSPRRPAGSPSWCSTRVSRAGRTTLIRHRGRVLHRTRRGPLRPLHPGRLHRGRQHPGGQHLSTPGLTRRRGVAQTTPRRWPVYSLASCPPAFRVISRTGGQYGRVIREQVAPRSCPAGRSGRDGPGCGTGARSLQGGRRRVHR